MYAIEIAKILENTDDVIEIISKVSILTAKKYHLNQYITKVKYDKAYPKRAIAYYKQNTKEIFLALNNIECYVKSILKNTSINNNKYNFYRNLIILQVLLHEFEHVKQLKTINSPEDNLETKILKASYFEYDKISKNYYDFYFYNKNIAPHEKLAESYSWGLLYFITTLYNDESLINLFYDNYLKSLYMGYDISINPVYDFLSGIGREDVYKQLDFYDEDKYILTRKLEKNYSFVKRASVGLPISMNEYFKLKRIYERNK